MTLTWDPPRDTNGIVEMYRVFYRETSGLCGEVSNSTDSNETTIRIEALKKFTEYSFTVAAETSAGVGPRSDEVKNRTASDSKRTPRKVVK